MDKYEYLLTDEIRRGSASGSAICGGVGEIVFDQRPHQPRAADRMQVPNVSVLQGDRSLGDVAYEQRRVLPFQWLGERRRGHVFREGNRGLAMTCSSSDAWGQ
jgi:hypothetical protein